MDMTGVGVSYSSTNSDRLRSPMLLPGLWNQDNQSQSSHGNNGVHSSYNSAPDVSRMKPFPSHDRPYTSATGLSPGDNWRYQPSDYVAMRNSNSLAPNRTSVLSNLSPLPATTTRASPPSSALSHTSPKLDVLQRGQNSSYGSSSRDSSASDLPSSLRSPLQSSMFSQGTANIHRDLDSVLDDIKRELGKSRPDMRLSLSIDASSLELSNPRSVSSRNATETSAAAASFAASRDSVASRIESLRSRLDSVSRHEALQHASRTSLSARTDSGQPTSALSSPSAPADSHISRNKAAKSQFSKASETFLEESGSPYKNKLDEAAKNSNLNLADGWEMKLDSPSGRIFYVNHTLKAISWEPPLPPTPPPKATSKSAALDQLSERTKALGAKLRDEMKTDQKSSFQTTNYRSSNAAVLTASSARGGKGLDGRYSSTDSSKSSLLHSAASSTPTARTPSESRLFGGVVTPRADDGMGDDMRTADRVAERVADRLAERLAQDLGSSIASKASTSAIGLYGSLGERAGSRLGAGGSNWHIGRSGEQHSRQGGLLGGGGVSSTDRWNLGSSGDVYSGVIRSSADNGGRQGTFWSGGDRWDHGAAGSKAAASGTTLRSSLDSAKLAILDRAAVPQRSSQTEDPILSLLNKASSQLWQHLLNSSPPPRSPEAQAPREGAEACAEFDRWVKSLTYTTPRELDESPIKRQSNNASDAPASVAKAPLAAQPALLPGVNANMAWQV